LTIPTKNVSIFVAEACWLYRKDFKKKLYSVTLFLVCIVIASLLAVLTAHYNRYWYYLQLNK